MTEDELKALWDSKTPQEGKLLDVFWNEPDTVQAAVNYAHNLKQRTDAFFTEEGIEKLEQLMKKAQSKQGGIKMEFDLRTEPFEIEGHEFIIQEYSSGAYEELQSKFFGDVRLSTKKDNLEAQMQQKRVNFTEFAVHQNLLGIQSWKYKGANVPIEIENWRKLPKRISDLVEKVIERLNPKDSEEFSNGHEDGSAS